MIKNDKVKNKVNFLVFSKILFMVYFHRLIFQTCKVAQEYLCDLLTEDKPSRCSFHLNHKTLMVEKKTSILFFLENLSGETLYNALSTVLLMTLSKTSMCLDATGHPLDLFSFLWLLGTAYRSSLA